MSAREEAERFGAAPGTTLEPAEAEVAAYRTLLERFRATVAAQFGPGG